MNDQLLYLPVSGLGIHWLIFETIKSGIYAFIFEGRDSTTYDLWIDDIAFFSGDPPESESIPASDDPTDDVPVDDVMDDPIDETEPADAGL